MRPSQTATSPLLYVTVRHDWRWSISSRTHPDAPLRMAPARYESPFTGLNFQLWQSRIVSTPRTPPPTPRSKDSCCDCPRASEYAAPRPQARPEHPAANLASLTQTTTHRQAGTALDHSAAGP